MYTLPNNVNTYLKFVDMKTGPQTGHRGISHFLIKKHSRADFSSIPSPTLNIMLSLYAMQFMNSITCRSERKK
jgi:hypothetical protein